MDYKKIYNKLIHRRSINPINSGYCENHHIIPKCMGGSDYRDNMIKLTAREHYIAHLLLTKIYPTNNKIWFSLNMMRVNNQYQKRHFVMNNRIYETLKIKMSEILSDAAKNKIRIYNIKTNDIKWLDKDKPIPHGWQIGSNHKTTLDKIRYYNAELDDEIMIHNTFDSPPGYIKGRRPAKFIYDIHGHKKSNKLDYIPDGWYVASPQKITAININTGESLVQYDVDSIKPGFVKSSIVGKRCIICKKQEYFNKTNRYLNIKKYCAQNADIITKWLVNRSNLPTEWIGETWGSIGFELIEIKPNTIN